MTSSEITSTAIIVHKRKRLQVSYVNDDDNGLDDQPETGEAGNEDNSHQDLDAYEHDLSATFGSTKKVPKRSAVKKQKLTPKPRSNRKKTFPLMSLPAELRDEIYELVLTDCNGIFVVSTFKKNRRTAARAVVVTDHRNRFNKIRVDRANPVFPALLAVSKQIHSESVGFLYHRRVSFYDTQALHAFLATVGSHRQFVRHVVIRSFGYGQGVSRAMDVAAFPLLGLCTDLRVLKFDCRIGYRTLPSKIAPRIHRDAHHFLEAFGSAKGRADAAVDILEFGDVACPYVDPQDRSGIAKCKDQTRKALRKMLGC